MQLRFMQEEDVEKDILVCMLEKIASKCEHDEEYEHDNDATLLDPMTWALKS